MDPEIKAGPNCIIQYKLIPVFRDGAKVLDEKVYSEITISDEEVTAFYNQFKGSFFRPDLFKISKITLQDEDGTVLFGPIQMQSDGGGLFKKDWK